MSRNVFFDTESSIVIFTALVRLRLLKGLNEGREKKERRGTGIVSCVFQASPQAFKLMPLKISMKIEYSGKKYDSVHQINMTLTFRGSTHVELDFSRPKTQYTAAEIGRSQTSENSKWCSALAAEAQYS